MLSSRVKLTKDGRAKTKDVDYPDDRFLIDTEGKKKRIGISLAQNLQAQGMISKQDTTSQPLTTMYLKTTFSKAGFMDSKTKDDQSDAWQEKIRHIKEYLKAYPDAPDAAKKKAELKELEAKVAGNTSYKEKLNKDSYYGITTGQEIGKHNGYKLSLHKLENDNWLVAQRRGETLRTNVGGSIDSAITKMKKIIDGYSTLIKSAEESGVTEDDVLPVGLHNDMPDEEFDAEQLQIGIKVEQEHTSDPEIAKAIAKDHLSEIKDYYTRLAKMEAEAGVTDAFPTGTREEEARLKQMRVNLETARRQGDQQEVKDIQKAINELEAKIRRETGDSMLLSKTKITKDGRVTKDARIVRSETYRLWNIKIKEVGNNQFTWEAKRNFPDRGVIEYSSGGKTDGGLSPTIESALAWAINDINRDPLARK